MNDEEEKIVLTEKQYLKNLHNFKSKLLILLRSQKKKLLFEHCVEISFFTFFTLLIEAGVPTQEIKELVARSASLAKSFNIESNEEEEQ